MSTKPARLLEGEEDKGKQWLAVVAIKLGRAPSVFIVPAASDPGKHSIWLRKGKDPKKRDLTGDTYKRFIKLLLFGKGNITDGTLKPARRPINLLHDRDAAHTAKAFTAFATTYNVNAVLLPPRSPDLNPLDYGVFGPVQKKLDKAIEEGRMTWDQQCSFLEDALKAAKVDAAIKQLPRRIARCIEAKGGHFE